MTIAKPFLRWPGGKSTYLELLHEHCPPGSVRSICVGGGAFEWALLSKGRDVALADANDGLVNAYKQLRDNLPRVLEALSKREATAEGFDAAKLRYNISRGSRRDTVGAAADLIQLNRMCFNGLYRENQDGHFNVAMDPGKVGCDLVRAELLTACSEALQGVPIQCLDFRVSIARAGRGDVVWFDSPYWPGPDPKGQPGLFGAQLRESFTAYTAAGFGAQDHADALEALVAARERGAWVLATNAWEDGWVSRYRARGFMAHAFRAGRPIACTQEGRATVSEVLFIGVPLA